MKTPLMLTKSSAFIIGPVAVLLGYVMEAIFNVLSKMGIPNIGLSIIIFTIVMYALMLPLTIKQQKFSKLQSIMQPELQAIQKKYKGKNDNASMSKMQEETQAVYKKYGVSATGSCLQLAIQFPILFALYRVIYNFPAYVGTVRDAFMPVVNSVLTNAAAGSYIQESSAARMFAKQFKSDDFINNVGNTVTNTYIDVLNRFSTADWTSLKEQFPALSENVDNTVSQLEKFNSFLGLNIANSPWFTMKDAFSKGQIAIIIIAVLVPVLAAATQLINIALMPQPASSGNAGQDSMANSMKTMNYMMPVMSAYFCLTLPTGLGLYWIAGAVIRSIQQVAINKHINKMDMGAYLSKVEEKNAADAKSGKKPFNLMDKLTGRPAPEANESLSGMNSRKSVVSDSEKKAKLEKANSIYSQGKYKENSLASKASMVREFNETKKGK